MAKANAGSFARLLTEAVYQIRHRKSKSVQAVQDDLGYALGKKGGSSIEYWRKGHVPSKMSDVEALTRLVVQQGGFTQSWTRAFLNSAGYPNADVYLEELFQTAPQTRSKASSPASHETKIVLPIQPTAFVGRQEELDVIKTQIHDPECRILTLVGPGGVGKTRLAIQAAEETAVYFPQGSYFVPLATLASPEFLLSAIANVVDYSFVDEIPQKMQLINFLRDKKLLLVMDNFEHLMMEAQLIADIISQAPHVQILLTSRERLNLHGEWVFDVSGMSFPARKIAIKQLLPQPDEDAVLQYSAVQLFLQSARRVRSDFEPTTVDMVAIVEICQLVDGFPLAIELAATWVRLLTCAEIAQEITHNFEFLATNWRDIPPRHRSLRAVFDYSWALLSEEEKEILCRLSVFHGGFSWADAVAVAKTSVFLLAQLADKSFLQGQITQDETAVSRYEMHELLRLFAVEKLNQEAHIKVGDTLYSDAMLAAYDAHARYYAQFLSERNPQKKRSQQAEILKKIGQTIENVRAAWHWSLVREQIELIELACDALFHFYDIRGWLEEGSEIFRTAVNTLRHLREQTQEPVNDVLWAKMLAREGQFAYRSGRYEQARLLLEESVPIFRQLNMRRETVFTLNLLGRIAYRQGLYEESENWCKESLSLCHDIPFPGGMVSALATIGHVAADRGDYDVARQAYQNGLDICERIGDQHNKARRLNELGNISWRIGAYDEAERLCHQSLALFRELDDRQGIAMTYKNLGNIAGDTGNYTQAETWYRQGLALCQEVGDKWGEAALSNNLGNIYWQSGQYRQARELCEQSVSVWRAFGFQWGIAGSLETLANIAIAQGEWVDAKSYIQEALEIGRDMQATPLVLDVLVSMAQLWAREGQLAQAQALLAFVIEQPTMDQEGRSKAEVVYHELGLSTDSVVPDNYDEQTLADVITAVLREIS